MCFLWLDSGDAGQFDCATPNLERRDRDCNNARFYPAEKVYTRKAFTVSCKVAVLALFRWKVPQVFMASSLFSLEGRIAVVLGGTSGLGHTIALGLAEAGANVVVSARRGLLVEKTASEIEGKGRKSLRVVADVRDRKSLVGARASILKQFGRVDILVNAAGVTQKLPTLEMKEEDWNEILETNLTGTLRGCQIFGEVMLKQGEGRIINIASLGSLLGLFEVAAYSASKSGVASLTRRSLAVEWSRYGVLVNAIVPGVFRTNMNAKLLEGTERGREFLLRTPMGRYGKAEELIGAAVFLASAASAFVTGQLIAVDGGILASGVNQ